MEIPYDIYPTCRKYKNSGENTTEISLTQRQQKIQTLIQKLQEISRKTDEPNANTRNSAN